MNCSTAHQRLLALERPARPTGELRQHLTDCPACRTWQKRLLEVETQAAQVPVPPPTRKAEFLLQFQDTSTSDPRPIVRLSLTAPPVPRKERGLQKLSLAIALAASLMIFALTWWLWPRPGSTESTGGTIEQSAPLLASRLRQEPRWAAAKTPRERLEVLSSLADEVQTQTRTLTQTGGADDLTRHAQLYRELVRDGILAQAEALDLPTSERYLLLTSLARKLDDASAEAVALAGERPTLAAPLREIAATAREGHERLRTLASRA